MTKKEKLEDFISTCSLILFFTGILCFFVFALCILWGGDTEFAVWVAKLSGTSFILFLPFYFVELILDDK